MTIDEGLLSALGVAQEEIEVYLPLLVDGCPRWGVDEPDEIAAFLATTVHESSRFTVLQENLMYSAQGLANTWARFSATGVKRGPPNAWAKRIAYKPDAIANAVYANRLGNGDEASGDGALYAGKGLIQTTGKDNYEALSYAWGVDCVAEPEKLLTPVGATVSACFFWKSNGCNELAQQESWETLRKRVNGGLIGLDKFLALTNTALQYLGAN